MEKPKFTETEKGEKCICPIPKRFRDSYFSVSSTSIRGSNDMLVYFSWYNSFSKIPPTASGHFAYRVIV
jgi:hypothetical protein